MCISGAEIGSVFRLQVISYLIIMCVFLGAGIGSVFESLVISYLIIMCVFLGAGIGSVFGSLVIGYARNPSLKQQLFSYAILGFALSEAMGLFCLMMAFLILFAF